MPNIDIINYVMLLIAFAIAALCIPSVKVLWKWIRGEWGYGIATEDRERARERATHSLLVALTALAVVAAGWSVAKPSIGDTVIALESAAAVPPSSAFSARVVKVQPPFESGTDCSPAGQTEWIRPLTEALGSDVALRRSVLVLLVGGHDVDELKEPLRQELGSNLVLAQRRAECVQRVLTQVMAPTRIRAITLARGSRSLTRLEASATRAARVPDDIVAAKAEDRAVEAIILSWTSVD